MSRRKGYLAAKDGREGRMTALGRKLLQAIEDGSDLAPIQAEFEARLGSRLPRDPETWAQLANDAGSVAPCESRGVVGFA